MTHYIGGTNVNIIKADLELLYTQAHLTSITVAMIVIAITNIIIIIIIIPLLKQSSSSEDDVMEEDVVVTTPITPGVSLHYPQV